MYMVNAWALTFLLITKPLAPNPSLVYLITKPLISLFIMRPVISVFIYAAPHLIIYLLTRAPLTPYSSNPSSVGPH